LSSANRGIGQALVEEALCRGAWRVYAGTRQPLDHPDERVTPLVLDITDPQQIRAAVERVASLDVLINNAGVAIYDDLGERAALEQHLAVNFYANYDLTETSLSVLTCSGGAIVNMLSLAAERRPGHPEGLSGGVRDRDLRRIRERGRGDLPRPDVGAAGADLAHGSRQGPRGAERAAPARVTRSAQPALAPPSPPLPSPPPPSVGPQVRSAGECSAAFTSPAPWPLPTRICEPRRNAGGLGSTGPPLTL
jgi:NAD(P)-dependent dehydrogenase (short-subunit alcohol dehydrogenase family)